MNAALRLSSFWEMKTSPRGRLPPDNVVIVPSCVVSPGRARSCPLVATWPEGRGSADPCVPRRPRQTQAPSHSYPAERKETHTQSEKSFRGDGDDDDDCSFGTTLLLYLRHAQGGRVSGHGHNVGSSEFCCGEKKPHNHTNETQTREERKRGAGRGKGRRGFSFT